MKKNFEKKETKLYLDSIYKVFERKTKKEKKNI